MPENDKGNNFCSSHLHRTHRLLTRKLNFKDMQKDYGTPSQQLFAQNDRTNIIMATSCINSTNEIISTEAR